MTNRNPRPTPQQKKGPYLKTNAYTQKPVFQQIAAILAFLVVLILHSIFIVPPIVAVIKHQILLVMLGVHYFLIIMIGYDYIILTVKDPADRLVSKQLDQSKQQQGKLKRCLICTSNVFLKSYHCMRCNRCTQGFDHHCKYLNNCVGSTNYQSFFRILAILTLYLINTIGQAIWVFVDSFSNKQLQDYMISKWPVLAAGVLIILLIIAVDSLLIFHIYLAFYRKMTTYQYIFRQTASNQSSSGGGVESQGRMNNQSGQP